MDVFDKNNVIISGKSQVTPMAKVYLWMFLGLIITGIASVITASSGIMFTIGFPGLLLLSLVEVAMVWTLSSRALKMSYSAAVLSFLAFAVLNGITLSYIFSLYQLSSIAYAFFISAGFFGFMSVYGLVTKSDLTSMGSFLMMGLIGVILASLVNMFLRSSSLDWMISFIGVAIFLGLAAYDSQKIKNLSVSYQGTPSASNIAIVGALMLYLDFINLFLFILRILGRRSN